MKSSRLRLLLLASAFALASCHGGSTGGVLPPSAKAQKQSLADPYPSAVLADAPTAYYRLDDTSPIVADSSGNALNGTAGASVVENASGLLPGSSDTAMNFPGTKSSAGIVNVPQNTKLQPPNAVSLEAWLRFSSAPATYTVVTGYGSDSTYAPYDLFFNGGKIIAQFYLSSGVLEVPSPNALAPNTTYYIVGTFDGTTGRLYVNGTLASSVSKTGTIANYLNGYGFSIGDDAAISDPAFNGTVDEVAVYAGKALSATSIQNHYLAGAQTSGGGPTPTPSPSPSASPPGSYASVVLQNNPTQFFKLGESSGPTAFDSSPSAINGTYVGAVTFGAAGPLLDEQSNAVSLPGGTASVGVSLPNPNAPSGTSYSIETWVFPILGSSYMTIWGYSGSHRLLVTSSGTLLSQFSGNFISKTALTTTKWHDVVFVYDAKAATASYYIDGAFDSSIPLSNANGAFTSAYYLGQYNTGTFYKWRGSLGQHAFFKSALSSAQVAALYAAAGYGSGTATPSPAPSYSDWSTFGDNLARTNYNPNETTLSSSNVSGLKLVWSTDLGAALTAQPIVATNVAVNGTPTTVLYIGTEAGAFYALNADTGATIWSQQLASVTSGCMDLPGGTFGITGTATFDKSTNRVYVADGHTQVHALDMSTGAEAAGWPVTIVSGFTKNHVYAALTYNPNNGLLYAETGSYCDFTNWMGTLASINTSTASIVHTFTPATPYTGDGMWGIGGVAIDASNNVYTATGNTFGGPADNSAFGDQLIQLDANLNVLAAGKPPLRINDQDFGATPMLFQPPGCPALTAAKQKSGDFLEWSQSAIAQSPLQDLAMAPATNIGVFIGVTAYSPVTNLVYVGDPHGGVAPFNQGLIALSVQNGCTLGLAWQQTVGPVVSSNDNDSPTVANGVVYFTDGVANQAFAFDASSGQMLWNSGAIISGPVMTSPTVDGRLYVSSWDHKLYAFGL